MSNLIFNILVSLIVLLGIAIIIELLGGNGLQFFSFAGPASVIAHLIMEALDM